MRSYIPLAAALVFCSGCLAANKDTGLVLHYTFDEGSGRIVRDKSGHGNDGKIVGEAEWVKEESHTALAFNGTNTYVECGNKPSLALAQAGTLEIWCFPHSIQGGLVTWHTGSGWGDARLVLGFINYGLVYKDLLVAVADGAWGESVKEAHNPGTWAHLVMTFDGSDITLFRNGVVLQKVQQNVQPATKGVPVRIGLIDGMGDAYFKGMVSEVRIYNRALSEDDILAHYTAGAKTMCLAVTGMVRMTPRLYAARGELAVEVDLRAAGEVPAGSSAKVALWNADKKTWVADDRREIPQDSLRVSVTFPTDNVVAGNHEVRLSVIDREGIPVGVEATETYFFPKRAQRLGAGPGTKILNNLVVELINKDKLPPKPSHELTFTNPRAGWVFMASTAEVKGQAALRISVDTGKDKAAIVQKAGDAATMETLRFLPAGERTLRIWCEGAPGAAAPSISKLIVRSVPEMMQCGYPAPSLAGYGAYDFTFLEKDVHPNITTHVGGVHKVSKAEQEEWKNRGRRWLLEQNVPHLVKREVPVTGDVAYDWWTKSYGFQSPLCDGVMADEFSNGDHPSFHGYIEAVKRITANQAFKDKMLFAWCCSETIHTVEGLSKRFVETLVASGRKIAHEAYLSERSRKADVQRFLDHRIGRQMRLWEKAFPGVIKQMVHVIGYMAAPPETLNVNPQVDFKVFLDMQFKYLANAPECFGLYGVMVYKARYADEETVRWAGRLFRHYCIEGNTDLLSDRYGYKYELDHIRNGDFNDGLEAWTVSEAKPGSISTREMSGLGRMQGRVVAAVGNHFLWTRRCDNKPNNVVQEIKGLVPGALYSMKMIIADYQDWTQGKSERKELGISLKIEGVEMIKDKCFMMPNHSFIRLGPFTKKGSGVPWHNYHSLVFRAKETTARLTISDWPEGQKPGDSAPVGQEFMYNFIEIQPYFEGR